MRLFLRGIVLLWALLQGGASYGQQCNTGGQVGGNVFPQTRVATTVNSVPSKSYIRVAVVQGIRYTFRNSVTGGISIYNDNNTNQLLTTSDTIANWLSSLSGYVRLYNCAPSGAGNLRTEITGGKNDIDSRIASGNNVWYEHVYQRLDNTAVAPTDSNAFTRYLGYRDTLGETFNNTFGSDAGTYALKSQAQYLLLNTNEYFAVRYYMNSTRPAGAYLADINGDDGIRLRVGGTLYFDRWVQQGNTIYAKQLFPLTGTSLLQLDYYESSGGNVVGFTNFQRVSNTISKTGSSATDTTICNNAAVSFTGTNTLTAAPVSSSADITVTYQWASSTNGSTYTNISGATNPDYSTPTLTTGTYYYRRTATVARNNSGVSPATIPVSVPDQSNVIRVTVRPAPTATLSGGGAVCQNKSVTLTVNNPRTEPVTVSYSTSGAVTGTGSVTVAGSSGATIPFSTTAVGTTTVSLTNVAYTTAPACSTTLSGVTATVTVQPLPTGTLTSNTPICSGKVGQLQFNATAGTSPYTLVISNQTYTGTTSGTFFNISPNPTTTTTYNLTKVTDANGCESP